MPDLSATESLSTPVTKIPKLYSNPPLIINPRLWPGSMVNSTCANIRFVKWRKKIAFFPHPLNLDITIAIPEITKWPLQPFIIVMAAKKSNSIQYRSPIPTKFAFKSFTVRGMPNFHLTFAVPTDTSIYHAISALQLILEKGWYSVLPPPFTLLEHSLVKETYSFCFRFTLLHYG